MSTPPELARRRAHFEERTRFYAARGYDRREAARFVAALLTPTDGPVLDVGTGKGLLAVAIAARGASVVTVDPDAVEQELAALLGGEHGVSARLQIVTGDAAVLPYPAGHFSAAASMDVLHHLEDPAPILEEMVRTLAPGGELLLADFSPEGMELVEQVHREEGRRHPNSGVTVDAASAVLQRLGLSPVLRLTRHLHDIAVFARKGRTCPGTGYAR